jgi:fatty-acid desaturase
MSVELLEEPVVLLPGIQPQRAPVSISVKKAPAQVPVLGRAAQGDTRNWLTTSFMVAFHVGALIALFMFSWSALAVFVATWLLAINIGIGMSYHRLLTHRGYKTPRWVEYVMAVCGTLALEGGPMFWVATHRIHHQLSDKEGDPHTPHDGKWWSHIGWIMKGPGLHNESSILSKYAPDLAKDRFHVWLSNWHWIPLVTLALGLLGVGTAIGGWHLGWSWVMWGIFLRTTLGLHSTWLVNSATHLWGSRRFETRDDSRNNLLVALVTGGEGWHNNHHAHPVSARHGLAWYEVDVNFYGIWLLKKLGLATDIKVAQYDKHDPRPAGTA